MMPFGLSFSRIPPLKFSSLLLPLLFLGACGGSHIFQGDLREKFLESRSPVPEARESIESPSLEEVQEPAPAEQERAASLVPKQEPIGSPGLEAEDIGPSPSEEGPVSRLSVPAPEDITGDEEAVFPSEGDGEELGYPQVSVVMNAQVQRHLDSFQARNRKHFRRSLENSGRYMPMIKQILQEENLPEDLAHLALIESGFNPKAYSSAGASGLWQFMSKTGRKYGLVINWWIDERRDPAKSTRAAAHYLRDLYERFRSWDLAQAGYNAGEGRIMRGLKRIQGKSFWSLARTRHISSETRNFVPKFMAAMIISKDPAAYGFVDLNIRKPVEYEEVPVLRPTALRAIAEASGVSLAEIQQLNLDLRRGVTPPNYPDYHLRVPKGTVERIATALKDLKDAPVRADRYLVQRGDTLGAIASAFGTAVEDLASLNAISNPALIRAGRELLIPSSSPRPDVNQAGLDGEAYVVRRGDTLSEIAQRHRVQLAHLIRVNGLNPREPIQPGDRILLRASGPVTIISATPPRRGEIQKPARGVHVVQKGDSLWKISRKYGVSLAHLLSLNGLDPKEPIQPGDRILLRASS
jgi:membrane-bound lytic murein transglycosylase D